MNEDQEEQSPEKDNEKDRKRYQGSWRVSQWGVSIDAGNCEFEAHGENLLVIGNVSQVGKVS